MEPPAATARMSRRQAGRCGRRCRAPAARATMSPRRSASSPKNVTLHTTLLGGGFGRKSKCDFAIEAALLSKEMGGAPVKVVWTREDDIRHGFYHTVTAERFEAGLDADNKVIAWRHRSAAPSLHGELRAGSEASQSTSSSAWAGSTRRSTCRTSAWRAARRRATCASAGSARSTTWRTPGRSSPSSPRSPASWASDPKDLLLEMIGPARIVDAREAGHHAVVGLRRAVRDLSGRHWPVAAGGRAGGREGRLGQEAAAKARGSASPRIAASSATSRRWSRSRSTTRARSRCRASTRRSIAASASIPSASARRSKARP